MTLNVHDFEVFKFADNEFSDLKNNNKVYKLNKHPYLDIVLTDHCNSNCMFCIADLIHDKLVGNFEIFKKKILFAIDKMHVTEVLLLGGEPTVAKDLVPMIKWLSDQNLDKIIMTTNGIRLAKDKKYREEVLSAGLTNLNISFMNVSKSKQLKITDYHSSLTVEDLSNIYTVAKNNNVKVRINCNIFKDNNDTVSEMEFFYMCVKNVCDSVKFSPLFSVDAFSVINYKTKWTQVNRLDDTVVEKLFTEFEKYVTDKYDLSIINNELQFGFVKNTLIPLRTPIVMNWNFGSHTGMMDKVVKHNQINNLKLLPNNELSLSWNREMKEYFIKTD